MTYVLREESLEELIAVGLERERKLGQHNLLPSVMCSCSTPKLVLTGAQYIELGQLLTNSKELMKSESESTTSIHARKRKKYIEKDDKEDANDPERELIFVCRGRKKIKKHRPGDNLQMQFTLK